MANYIQFPQVFADHLWGMSEPGRIFFFFFLEKDRRMVLEKSRGITVFDGTQAASHARLKSRA